MAIADGMHRLRHNIRKRTHADRAQRALRESEARYRAVVEQVSDAIFLLDVETMCLLEANMAFQKLLGYSAEEISGLSIFDILPYERERIERATRRAIEQGDYSVRDRLYRRKDGSLVNVEVSITPISYGGKSVLCEVVRDITSRKTAEVELRKSRDQLEVILQGVADGITVQDPGGRLIYANAAAARVMGYSSSAELLSAPVTDITRRFELLDEAGQPMPPSQLPGRYALRGVESPDTIVGWRFQGSGEVRWSMVKARPVKDEQGRVQFAINIFHDITERKKLEQRKDDFVALASHELKTPITSVKIFTQLLAKRLERASDNDLTKDAVRQLGRIDEQLNKLTNLVRTLLDASSLGAGKLQFTMQEFAIDDLVSETVEDLQTLSDKHELVLKGEAKMCVVADRERIAQVLTNFITNAIKYSPEGGPVIIESKAGRNEVVICVQDFGIGIPEGQKERVFDRFFQVSGADPARGTYPGLGLGLYISSEIIKRHAGRIWIESELGRGSTFYFSLPLMDGREDGSPRI